MAETPEGDDALPPSLRWLKWLVILLTATLIGGVLTVVWLLVTRMPVPMARPTVPPSLQMPAGATAAAITMGTGWIAVVTTANHILVFGADGKMWQDVTIKMPSP